jgi:hypothetical protein
MSRFQKPNYIEIFAEKVAKNDQKTSDFLTKKLEIFWRKS